MKSKLSTHLNKKNRKKTIHDSASIEPFLFEKTFELYQIDSDFLRQTLQTFDEGVICFNQAVECLNAAMEGISSDISQRKMFFKENRSTKDWLRLKNESFEFAITKITEVVSHITDDILPKLSEVIDLADDKTHHSNETIRLVRQRMHQARRAVSKRQRQLAALMGYLLERCADENKLSMITPQQFRFFSQFIARYGFEQTKGKLKRLFELNPMQSGIIFHTTSSDQEFVITPVLPQSPLHNGKPQKEPKPNRLAALLPGSEVFRDFLPQQFYTVAQINTQIKFFEKAAKSDAHRISNESKQQVFSPLLKELQENLDTIKMQVNKVAKDSGFLKKLAFMRTCQHEIDFLKEQERLLNEAIDAIDRKWLKGWRATIASLFNRNPNPLLGQWKSCYQDQQKKCLHQKLILFQKIINYVKSSCQKTIFPDVDLLYLLRTQAKEAEEVIYRQADIDLICKFSRLYDQYQTITDIASHFIICVQQEDPNFIIREPVKKNGLTIFVPNRQRLELLTSKVICRETPEKSQAIQTVSQWLGGDNLPSSLEEMKYILKPLFKTSQSCHAFIKVLMEKYIKATVYSVRSPAFQLLQEYQPLFAEEWINDHQQFIMNARYFLDQLLEINGEQEVIFIKGKPMLVTSTNFVEQARQLQAMSTALPGHVDYWTGFKRIIRKSLQDPKNFLYREVECAQFMAEIEDTALTIEYGRGLLEYLIAERQLGKLLDAKTYFYQQQGQNELLKKVIDECLSKHLQSKPLIPFLGEVCDVLGNLSHQQTFRVRCFEEMLHDPELAKEHVKTQASDGSIDDLILYYGKNNIPKLIEIMEQFLTKNTQENSTVLELICRIVTHEFVTRFHAMALSQKLKDYKVEHNQMKSMESETDEILARIKHAQYAQSTKEVQKDCIEIQSRIKAMFHRFSLHQNFPEEISKDRTFIDLLLRKMTAFLHELSMKDRPKVIQAWINKFDHSQSDHASHCVLNTPPFPKPHLWFFFDEIRVGFSQIGCDEQDPLVQQFVTLWNEFPHYTSVANFFIEKVQDFHTFSMVRRQTKDGLVYMPVEAELTGFIDYVLAQPLTLLEKDAIGVIDVLLKGDSYPVSLEIFKQQINVLFAENLQSEKALNQFIELLMVRYIVPRVTSVHSPVYHFLQQVDPIKAKEWVKKNKGSDDVALDIFNDLKKQSYQSAINKLKVLLVDLRVCPHLSEDYNLLVITLDYLMDHLFCLVKELADKGSQQQIALLESYFVTILPESQQKNHLVAFSKKNHPDYFFAPNDQLSLSIFSLYSQLLRDIDPHVFPALKNEYFSCMGKSTTSIEAMAQKIKSIRDRMIFEGISELRHFKNLTNDEKEFLKLTNKRTYFFKQDKILETTINISVKPYFLLQELGKIVPKKTPIEYLEEVRKLNDELFHSIQTSITSISVRHVLCGAYGDGFLSELPELVMELSAPQEEKDSCKSASREAKHKPNSETMTRWGDTLFSVGRYRKAAACYDEALRKKPYDFDILCKCIQAKFAAKKYSAVIDAVSKTINQFSDSQKNRLIYYRVLACEQLEQINQIDQVLII